jgi:hypothetical protein
MARDSAYELVVVGSTGGENLVPFPEKITTKADPWPRGIVMDVLRARTITAKQTITVRGWLRALLDPVKVRGNVDVTRVFLAFRAEGVPLVVVGDVGATFYLRSRLSEHRR